MEKKGKFKKLKKLLIIAFSMVTLLLTMPAKSEASVLQDAVDLILGIPDAVMYMLNDHIAGMPIKSHELKINIKGIDATNGTEGTLYNFEVTPYDIFTSGRVTTIHGYIDDSGKEVGTSMQYIKLPILDVNFFRDFKKIDTNGDGQPDKLYDNSEWNSVTILGPTVGKVYKNLTNFVLILMLVVLVYIGIRIIIASAVTDQVKYKQWLVDWVVGICLLLVMHFIMSFCMNINEVILDMIGKDSNVESMYISLPKLGDFDLTRYNDWKNVKKCATPTIDSSTGQEADNQESNYSEKVAYFYNKHLDIHEGSSDGDTYKPVTATGEETGNNTFTGYFAPKTKSSIWGNAVFLNARVAYRDGGAEEGVQFVGKYLGQAIGNSIIPIPGVNLILSKYSSQIGESVGSKIGWVTGAVVESMTDSWSDVAIYKGNTIEYIRTLISFGSKYVYVYTGNDTYQEMTDGEHSLADPVFAGYAILYLILVFQTVVFLWTYLKRVFKLAFYTMIAPLIAFMYPIDKLGDGKAQAFNTWFKDYLFNILIQPLHLLLYTVFIYSAMDIMNRSIIYAIAVYAYMMVAEKFFKKIFGFDKHASGGTPGLASPSGMMAMRGFDKLAGLGPHGKNAGSGASQRKRGKVNLAKRKPGSGGPPNSSGAPGSAGNSNNGGMFDSDNGSRAPGSSGGYGGLGFPGGLGGSAGAGNQTGGNNNPIPNSSNGKVPGRLGSLANVLGSRAAYRITGGATSNLGSALRGHKKDIAKNFAKSAGKSALRAGARIGGAALWAAGSAVAGTVASAVTGENQMGKALSAGAIAGWSRGGRNADSLLRYGSDLAKDVKIEQMNALKNSSDPSDNAKAYKLAALERYENLMANNPEALSHLNTDQEEMLMNMLEYGDIAPDDIDKVVKYADKAGGNVEEAMNYYNLEKRFGDLEDDENFEKAVAFEMRHNSVKIDNDDPQLVQTAEDMEKEEVKRLQNEAQISDDDKQKVLDQQKEMEDYRNIIKDKTKTPMERMDARDALREMQKEYNENKQKLDNAQKAEQALNAHNKDDFIEAKKQELIVEMSRNETRRRLYDLRGKV